MSGRASLKGSVALPKVHTITTSVPKVTSQQNPQLSYDSHQRVSHCFTGNNDKVTLNIITIRLNITRRIAIRSILLSASDLLSNNLSLSGETQSSTTFYLQTAFKAVLSHETVAVYFIQHFKADVESQWNGRLPTFTHRIHIYSTVL